MARGQGLGDLKRRSENSGLRETVRVSEQAALECGLAAKAKEFVAPRAAVCAKARGGKIEISKSSTS